MINAKLPSVPLKAHRHHPPVQGFTDPTLPGWFVMGMFVTGLAGLAAMFDPFLYRWHLGVQAALVAAAVALGIALGVSAALAALIGYLVGSCLRPWGRRPVDQSAA